MESEPEVLVEGSISFTIESRILRELGERLVRQPEVAVVELIKNAYDADATTCFVNSSSRAFVVTDDGSGMTLHQFERGWMRVGTSSKLGLARSRKFQRRITGEKGIGRFAVRFLGHSLQLTSVARDESRGELTLLTADFDWAQVDASGELNAVQVPYRLERAPAGAETGTKLVIRKLRPATRKLELKQIRSSSLAVVSPLRALLPDPPSTAKGTRDPGFSLKLGIGGSKSQDITDGVLNGYAFRAVTSLLKGRLRIDVFRQGEASVPVATVSERYESRLDEVFADIRFFPRRLGQFRDLDVDGRRAYSWIRTNSGVAVFDKGFRVSPYGDASDDWLLLRRDAARNSRVPESSVAMRNFPMSAAEAQAPSENWMLRLPEPAQLVGAVRVNASRDGSQEDQDAVLVPAADREGFIQNQGFSDLFDVIRGSVEAIAFADRQEQRREEERRRRDASIRLRTETRHAIEEVESAEDIPSPTKQRLVAAISATASAAEDAEQAAKDRQQQLEVMSLLGVVAGFMTHEFGSALTELRITANELTMLAEELKLEAAAQGAQSLRTHIENLEQYVHYSTAYIQSSGDAAPLQRYPVLPRIRQTVGVYGSYAEERDVKVELGIDRSLLAPAIPVTLYNGVALNLFSNALKAVTGSSGSDPRIAFRAWNEQGRQVLEVSDTGVGIPPALRERVFDPLFTTTASRNDPLGSGMGLGLSLVRRTVEAFGGSVSVVDPSPGFNTSVRVSFPLQEVET